jgi:arsenical pump membrane protein
MTTATDALTTLAPALAFLLAGVPLAALLDRVGFFTAAARLVTAETSSLLGLWVFAALVTIVLNLDTTVVLLTPLFIRIAHRRGIDPRPLALIPLLLASLASSLLPVSNLTNLIAAGHTGFTTLDLAAHLGLPTVAACAVGWWAFHRRHPVALPATPTATTSSPDEAPDRHALARGGAVVAFVLVGFVLGPSFGIPAWAVALVADMILVAMTRWVPWRHIPVLTAALVAVVGVAVTLIAPTGPGVLDHDSPLAMALLPLGAAVTANIVNNLPALLVALRGTTTAGWGLYAWLLGVNAGAALLPVGALANVLWRRVAHDHGQPVDWGAYATSTFPVVVPAFAAAVAVLVVERLLVG